MPLYEYRCTACDRPFERLARSFNDRPDCPHCGAADVTRLFSTFAVATGGSSSSGSAPAFGGCGEGPPCGAAQCGRLPN